jgi:hypothetical protein
LGLAAPNFDNCYIGLTLSQQGASLRDVGSNSVSFLRFDAIRLMNQPLTPLSRGKCRLARLEARSGSGEGESWLEMLSDKLARLEVLQL